MRTKVSCEDAVILKGFESRNESGLGVGIRMESGGDKEIVFYQSYGFMGSFTHIPISDWAKVKDKVDRLIIRTEELWKEES